MFMVTLRKGGLHKAVALCVCGALVVGSALGINALTHSAADATEASALGTTLQVHIADVNDLIAFAQGYGVQLDPASSSVTTVIIPRKWDDSFQAFHEVVTQSGLSLKKYKGKQVDKWVALIPAECNDAQKMYLVALVYKEVPVGAYRLQKPSGEVSALSLAKSTALTPEELAANADFGTATNVEAVGEGAAETGAGTAAQTAEGAAAETVTDGQATQAANGDVGEGGAPTVETAGETEPDVGAEAPTLADTGEAAQTAGDAGNAPANADYPTE